MNYLLSYKTNVNTIVHTHLKDCIQTLSASTKSVSQTWTLIKKQPVHTELRAESSLESLVEGQNVLKQQE